MAEESRGSSISIGTLIDAISKPIGFLILFFGSAVFPVGNWVYNYWLETHTAPIGAWTVVWSPCRSCPVAPSTSSSAMQLQVATGQPTPAPTSGDQASQTSPTRPETVPTSQPSIAVAADNVPCQTLRRLEIFNPGPGDINNVHVEVTVSDPCRNENCNFNTGLKVRCGPGVTKSCKDNGDTTVHLFPNDKGLKPGQSFWAIFESPVMKWEPQNASIIGPAQRVIAISSEQAAMPSMSVTQSTSGYALIGFFILAVLVFAQWLRSRFCIRQLIEAEVLKRTPEIESRALNACLLQQKETPDKVIDPEAEKNIGKPPSPKLLTDDR